MDQQYQDLKIIDVSVVPFTISFSFYSPREICNLSSVEIICPIFFDNKGFSILNGLCDPRMGVNYKKDYCKSCGENYIYCPGHFGHVDFSLPIGNPFLKNLFLNILRTKCSYCNFFKISCWKLKLYYLKFLLMDIGISLDFFFEIDLKCLKKKRNKKIFTWILNLVKQISEIVKKKWKIKNLPRLAPIQKGKRGKFWRFYLQIFLKINTQTKDCFKCNRSNLIFKNFFNGFSTSNENFFSLKKNFGFFEKINYFFKDNSFSFCSEQTLKITFKKLGFSNLKTFQLKKQIDELWDHEKNFCELIWGSLGSSNRFHIENGSEIFFLSSILVPPTRFRPVYFSRVGRKKIEMETNPQNFYFMKILKKNQQILLGIGSSDIEHRQNLGLLAFDELEKTVGNFFDNSSNFSVKKKKNPIGVRQQLEKKFGIFRMYIMGKRVFHSARSIIVPDPFLETYEAGIPWVFTESLTFPININFFNFNSLKIFSLKKNTEKIKKKVLFQTSFGENVFLDCTKKNLFLNQLMRICYKHFYKFLESKKLNFGINRLQRKIKPKDFVLLNRQPSLHKASLMAHSTKIFLKSKCIKIHYSNCNPYNADFDGDEMNLHFPQNYMAMSEGLVLSSTYKNSKIPTNGIIIRSLIQDNIISGLLLTRKDIFLNDCIFSQLISSLPQNKKFFKIFYCPCILKPKILWTGKQVVSVFIKTILGNDIDFMLESRTRISKIFFGQDETKILIRNGELLRGIFDGSQIGKSKHGVIHAFNEIYGGYITDKLLSHFSKLFIFFQRIFGFTTGIDDLIPLKKIDQNRLIFLRKENTLSKISLRKVFSKHGLFVEFSSLKILNFDFRLKIIGFLCGHKLLFDLFNRNLKNIMSGIFSTIIENTIPGGLEKNPIINGFSQMTLSGAKGSSLNTFQICSNLGQTELEGGFISRGLGGKTLPTFHPFDISSRANGFISQRFLTGLSEPEYFFHCMAGREGLLDTSVKTSQSGYVQRSLIKHLESLKLHYDWTVRFGDESISQLIFSQTGLNSNFFDLEHFLTWFSQNSKKSKKKTKDERVFISNQNSFSKEGKKIFKKNFLNYFFSKTKILIIGKVHLKKIQKTIKNNHFLRKRRISLWEKFLEEKKFIRLYQNNLEEPGEPIGILAAQSLGEPCTQMTLNTFHFAGKLISKNNFGIPRLREILLNASKYPKNPTMSVFFKKKIPFKVLSCFEKRFKKIFLFDLIENLFTFSEKKGNIKFLTFRFRIIPKNQYKHQLSVKKLFILNQFKILWKNIKKIYFEKIFRERHLVDFLKKHFYDKNIKKKKHWIEKGNFFRFLLKHNLGKVQNTNIFNLSIKKNQIDLLFFLNNNSVGLDSCIREIPMIKNGFIDYKERVIHTEGVNFFFFWNQNDFINLKKISSNDIYAIRLIYGIEAARRTIHQELNTIFKIQTILINSQHFDLISDYMTRLGNLRGFDRRGIAEENLLQKVTYETAVDFLINSAIYQNIDTLSSISSSISLGKPCEIGTGSFSLF